MQVTSKAAGLLSNRAHGSAACRVSEWKLKNQLSQPSKYLGQFNQTAFLSCPIQHPSPIWFFFQVLLLYQEGQNCPRCWNWSYRAGAKLKWITAQTFIAIEPLQIYIGKVEGQLSISHLSGMHFTYLLDWGGWDICCYFFLEDEHTKNGDRY